MKSKISAPDDVAAMRRTALQYSLSRTAIFSGLPEEDLQRLSGYAVLRSVARGSFLFREGDPVVGFFVVRSGVIHVHRLSAEGGEQIIHQLRPGESFAERALVSDEGYPASARAAEASEVILIPAAEFKRHQKLRPDLAWRMVASMSHQLRGLVAKLEGLRYHDAETRLLHWILQRCPTVSPRKTVEIALGVSQGELAAELATRRETLSRLLRKLRAAQHLELTGRTLRVRRVEALRQLFQEKVAPR